MIMEMLLLRRRPAWTDRVLFKANTNAYQGVTLDVKQTSYTSVESYTVSDHKPVYSEFNIKVCNFNALLIKQVDPNPPYNVT